MSPYTRFSTRLLHLVPIVKWMHLLVPSHPLPNLFLFLLGNRLGVDFALGNFRQRLVRCLFLVE